jgi:hypothetical protein
MGPEDHISEYAYISPNLVIRMVSLPELENCQRYWLEIWYGDSAWETGGHHPLLPTRDRPEITSIHDFSFGYFLNY